MGGCRSTSLEYTDGMELRVRQSRIRISRSGRDSRCCTSTGIMAGSAAPVEAGWVAPFVPGRGAALG